MKNDDWKRTPKILVSYLLVVGLFQFFAYLLLGISINELNVQETIFQMTVIGLSGAIGTLLIIWFFCRYIDKQSIQNLGLKRPKKPDIALGLLIGFAIMLIAFLILTFTNQITVEKIHYCFWDILLSAIFFACVSFSEELLIRGYVLNNLLSSFDKYLALAMSSVLFAMMHLTNQNLTLLPFINLLFAGILLGISYIYTKNLWFSMALHFTWNFSQGTIFGFSVSGNDVPSFIVQEKLENNIWNGGDFGFEGSIFCTLFQIVCIYILYLFFNKKKSLNLINKS